MIGFNPLPSICDSVPKAIREQSHLKLPWRWLWWCGDIVVFGHSLDSWADNMNCHIKSWTPSNWSLRKMILDWTLLLLITNILLPPGRSDNLAHSWQLLSCSPRTQSLKWHFGELLKRLFVRCWLGKVDVGQVSGETFTLSLSAVSEWQLGLGTAPARPSLWWKNNSSYWHTG